MNSYANMGGRCCEQQPEVLKDVGSRHILCIVESLGRKPGFEHQNEAIATREARGRWRIVRLVAREMLEIELSCLVALMYRH